MDDFSRRQDISAPPITPSRTERIKRPSNTIPATIQLQTLSRSTVSSIKHISNRLIQYRFASRSRQCHSRLIAAFHIRGGGWDVAGTAVAIAGYADETVWPQSLRRKLIFHEWLAG